MGTSERKKFSMTCRIYLFLIYEEFRICQEFFIILLTSFFSLSVAWGPLVSCPRVLRIYSLVVFFYQWLTHLSTTRQYWRREQDWSPLAWIFHKEQSDGELETGLLGFDHRFPLTPGSWLGAGGIWACLWATVSPTLRSAWFFLEWLESFLMKAKGPLTVVRS